MLPNINSSLALAVILLGVPASATSQSYICQDSAATGFNWVNGNWVQQVFRPLTYTISKSKETDQNVSDCLKEAARMQVSEEITPGSKLRKEYGCYVLTEMGKPKSTADLCESFYVGDELRAVDCQQGIIFDSTYSFIPNGEIIRVVKFSAPRHNPLPDDDRDSLVISMGHCNSIE